MKKQRRRRRRRQQHQHPLLLRPEFAALMTPRCSSRFPHQHRHTCKHTRTSAKMFFCSLSTKPPLVPRNAIYDLRHRACAHKLAYFIFSISVCCLFWLFYVFSLPPPPDVVVAMVVGIWNYCICCDCWLLLSLFYGIKKKSKPLKEPTAGQPTSQPTDQTESCHSE